MLYNEEYILSKIRNLENQVAALTSTIGAIIVINNAGGQLLFGSSDPVDPPMNPLLAALFYNEETSSLWYWSVSRQAWTVEIE